MWSKNLLYGVVVVVVTVFHSQGSRVIGRGVSLGEGKGWLGMLTVAFSNPLLRDSMLREPAQQGDLILSRIPWSMHSQSFIPGQANRAPPKAELQMGLAGMLPSQKTSCSSFTYFLHVWYKGLPQKGGVLAKRALYSQPLRGSPSWSCRVVSEKLHLIIWVCLYSDFGLAEFRWLNFCDFLLPSGLMGGASARRR